MTRKLALTFLAVMFAVAAGAELLAPASYETQFREAPNAPASRHFPLGTDQLGRDRLSRLLYGSRVSLLLAPAAALLATGLAAIAGAAAALLGKWPERLFLGATDLSLSLPWLFLLLTARAMLPLDVSPWISVTITFLLLGILGWAGPARIVRASVASMRGSEFLLQACASGCAGFRLFRVHLAPNLKPVLFTQFLIAVPVFIVAEANLGILGLGVTEPMPSWGSLIRELENFSDVRANPSLLAPVVLLVLVVVCFQLIASRKGSLA